MCIRDRYKYSQPFAETVCGSGLQQRRHRHLVRTTMLKRGLSVIVQLAEAWTFGYCAQYKYSQPFAETVCGSELQQRRHRHSVRTTGRNVDFRLLYNWLKRGLSIIVLSINTASHLLKLCVAVNCSSGVTGTLSCLLYTSPSPRD